MTFIRSKSRQAIEPNRLTVYTEYKNANMRNKRLPGNINLVEHAERVQTQVSVFQTIKV
jgi:hypothetical protein